MSILESFLYGENFYDLFLSNYKRAPHVANEPPLPSKVILEKNKEIKPQKSLPVLGIEREGNKGQSENIHFKYDLDSNASSFAVFARVRAAVLEAETLYKTNHEIRNNGKVKLRCCNSCFAICKFEEVNECLCHREQRSQNTFRLNYVSGNEEGEDADADRNVDSDYSDETTKRDSLPKVPQIVGAGLRCMFELILESKQIHPELCTRALKALLDVIQGQYPESFKTEPNALIDQLFDLLLDMATFNNTTGISSDSNESGCTGYTWSSVACSTLLGLCVARGDTGKTLKAIAAILMSSQAMSGQTIMLPTVLNSLQRSVIAVALNHPAKPEILLTGFPSDCQIGCFSISDHSATTLNISTQPAIATDGCYLYVLLGRALLKIGSGYGGSLKGYVYAANESFGKDVNGWLGYADNQLFYRRISKKNMDNFDIVDQETLCVTRRSHLTTTASTKEVFNMVFSDGATLNAICTIKDDSLVVRSLNTGKSSGYDLPLKLTKKGFRTLGYSQFEAEVLTQNQIQKIVTTSNSFEPLLANENEFGSIICGKEFGLVRTTAGKVFYYGKPPALGLKAVGKSPTVKLTELFISKVSTIIHMSIGHDGMHALFVASDGSCYFTGTARRCEDGDLLKTRRQPKASKPKKITKIEGHEIVHCSCNNGTSAFVTRTGKLIMFGKDTSHCDGGGYVTDLFDQHIMKVALGKAHCVSLNDKGQIFTFGLNNKGQCGRAWKSGSSGASSELNSQSMDSSASTMTTTSSQSFIPVDGNRTIKGGANGGLCYPDEHVVSFGHCRICTLCKECTGYNIACVCNVSVPFEERVGGSNCTCGQGCAGCNKCGACATCINYQENENFSDLPKSDEGSYSTLLKKTKGRSGTVGSGRKYEADASAEMPIERDQPRVAPLPPQRLMLPSNSPVVQISCGLHHTVVLTLAGEVFTFGSNQYGQLGTGDLQPVNGVTQVKKIHGVIVQVAAGSNHTILLNHKGAVYTFGNYLKGQLGRLPNGAMDNDTSDSASRVEDMFGFSNLNKNDSGNSVASKRTLDEIILQRQKYLWHCIPAVVTGIGSSFGKRATWIGGSGDQTFICIDESIITAPMLANVNVVADRNTIVLLPSVPLSFDCLTINRRDGSCHVHDNNQVRFPQRAARQMKEGMKLSSLDKRNSNGIQTPVHNRRQFQREDNKPVLLQAFALDPVYGNLWTFDPNSKMFYCYNVLASAMADPNMRMILKAEVALPMNQDQGSTSPSTKVTRHQAALNLLACVDILTCGNNSIPYCFDRQVDATKNANREPAPTSDFQTICRFENLGGGWGYSGHSIEAIRFMCDTDIVIGGFGIFGGRGEYTCKLKLWDLGPEGGTSGFEKEGALICETEDVPYECPSRAKFNLMLPKVVNAVAGRWFLVWAKISGPSSDCGAAGQATITTDDQVVFTFKSSKKANNGTDVNSGQIPSIIYKIVNRDAIAPGAAPSSAKVDNSPNEEEEAVHRISKLFAASVTKECFDSLITLCRWSWDAFKVSVAKSGDTKQYLYMRSSLDRLVYITKACLRLLRKYIDEIYPNDLANKKPELDVTKPRGIAKSTSKNVNKDGDGIEFVTTKNSQTKRCNTENILLAECVGEARALLMQILCDKIKGQRELHSESYRMCLDIFQECHRTFETCFNAFFPTSNMKWNILCDLLRYCENGILHASLMSAVVAGLCSNNVNLRNTFSLLNPQRDNRSIVSPSDNSGLPMLSSVEDHTFPVLVEQMIYRTQQEKHHEFQTNLWTFKDVLANLLRIISRPIIIKADAYPYYMEEAEPNYDAIIHRDLIENCCNLLKRVLAEIVYQSCMVEADVLVPPVRSLQSTGSRYTRTDASRTWNTGNFGPDAISFSVDRAGIAIAGAMIYSGAGSYDYQLELLQDTMDSKLTSQNRWEVMESVAGTYDHQEVSQNDMVEIRFARPVTIKEYCRYAIRYCSQGAKTSFGDAGVSSLRGNCGVSFSFYPCDLSFNGTTPNRGQIPCILYYTSPYGSSPNTSMGGLSNGKIVNEIHARDIALQIAREIIRECKHLLSYICELMDQGSKHSANAGPVGFNTPLVDSEHNITPIEEHLDVSCLNRSNLSTNGTSVTNSTRELTKKFESFTKGIVETIKLKTNPFDCEIEMGATEISCHEHESEDRNQLSRYFSFINRASGQKDNENGDFSGGNHADDDDDDNYRRSTNLDCDEHWEIHQSERSSYLLNIFNSPDSTLFNNLLPVVLALIGPLVKSDPKSSVQILGFVREILPYVTALNKNQQAANIDAPSESADALDNAQCDQIVDDLLNENLQIGHHTKQKPFTATKRNTWGNNCNVTTSNHYCIVESEHPYKSASITTYRVDFPECVQWFTVEFDAQSGTIQPEDSLTLSIPVINRNTTSQTQGTAESAVRVQEVCINNMKSMPSANKDRNDWITVKSFNSPSNWNERSLLLPGNRLELSLQSASNYLNDQRQSNRYGFKCLIVGFDNPIKDQRHTSSLIRLEQELSYLAGMCCANLLKKDLIMVDDGFDHTLNEDQLYGPYLPMLTKGFTLSDSVLSIEQALGAQLPIGCHSNERQFLKDFVCCAPGSSGARLAAWLQPESRLDVNKCELKVPDEAIYCGWPVQLAVVIRDQYGDIVSVPDIKVEVNAVPADQSLISGSRKIKRSSMANSVGTLSNVSGTLPVVPRVPYEVTVKDKMCYKAITFMKTYEDYSFEELRYVDPVQSRTMESFVALDQGNGTFSCCWTPVTAGLFSLTVVIDGFALEEVYRVRVKDAGAPPPPSQKLAEKCVAPSNKLRQFIAKYSAGLRIRTHPTLQSAQVGIVKMNGIIAFVDEVHNDDGTWVRLSTESIRQHVVTTWFPNEAWCLQYNQHLNKTLLFPLVDRPVEDSPQTEDHQSEADVNVGTTRSGGTDRKSVSEAISEMGSSDDKRASKNPFLSMDSFSEVEEDVAENKSDDVNNDDSGQSSLQLGNTIAVVVGEGANKIQALHKWLKGDSVDLKSGIRKRFEVNPGLSEERKDYSPPRLQISQHRSDNDSGTLTRQKSGLVCSTPTVVETSKISRKTKLNHISRPTSQLKMDRGFESSSTSGSRTASFEDCTTGSPLKRALPPTLAESLRALFAAFLWHESIVHDAMSCASFLKFHPTLPKCGEMLSQDYVLDKETVPLTKEQRAQQRHSVEVAHTDSFSNVANYSNSLSSTIDTLTKSGLSSIYNRRRTLQQQEKQKLQSLPEIVPVLPPALRCLVVLWEKLCSNSVSLVQNRMKEPIVGRDVIAQYQSPLPRNKNEHIFDGTSSGGLSNKLSNTSKAANRYGVNKKVDSGSESQKQSSNYCELCNVSLVLPVTYHMRTLHPGCGKSSRGKGYNSVGSYCNGWAGNCGEGGKGVTSWYLLCEECRNNYMALRKGPNPDRVPADSYGIPPMTKINIDDYKNIKENALFLLELSNEEPDFIFMKQRKSLFSAGPPEYHGFDDISHLPGPSSRANGYRDSRTQCNIKREEDRHKSTDLYWPVLQNFACYHSLMQSSKQEPEWDMSGDNIVLKGEHQRPFSDIFEGVNLHKTINEAGPLEGSKFHRSFSMGHGWQLHYNNNNAQYTAAANEDASSRGRALNGMPVVTADGVVVMRRKNRSSCEDDLGSVLLCNPSNNLRNLVPEVFAPSKQVSGELKDYESINEVSILSRPTMAFVFDCHDLTKLRSIMKRSLRVAVCRTYALQALNWLLKSVTQVIGVHDLMWWFVTALTDTNDIDGVSHGSDREEALDHPVRCTKLSGHMSLEVSHSLHAFLQSVADLTLLLPPGSSLQQMGVQCFGMRFRQSDHSFLHKSQVFGNISKILSRYDDQCEDNNMKLSTNVVQDGSYAAPQDTNTALNTLEKNIGNGACVVQLEDLHGLFEVTVSSRPAMAGALIDNSTETFWESDEEDRNKSKFIEIALSRMNCTCNYVFAHIDNSRDIANRVQTINFFGGQSLGDLTLLRTIDMEEGQQEVAAGMGSWLSASVKGDMTHFRIVLTGQDATLRVRNVKLIGQISNNVGKMQGNGGRQWPLKLTNAAHIQQRNCEAATLRVFRLLTGQVFGKLILGQRDSNNSPVEKNNIAQEDMKDILGSPGPLLSNELDMREHMVGILFSRSKLTHLQKQVIVHIVYAIRKETYRAKVEWEVQQNIDADQKSEATSENSRSMDTYCFEMLSMVLALSGSSVGRSYLSQQHGLLKDLIVLLHVGSDRVQRQVTSLLRRILPEISPECLMNLLSISRMPPLEFNIVHHGHGMDGSQFDMDTVGLIDVFLAVIAKALQLQVKTKGDVQIEEAKNLSQPGIGNASANNKGATILVKMNQCIDWESASDCAEFDPDWSEDQCSGDEKLTLNRRKGRADYFSASSRWFLRGHISNKQAENMISFLRDLITGKFTEAWSNATKAAVAEAIINLTRLDSTLRAPGTCIKSPTLWLALASLCVLDREHVEKLSSSQWSKLDSRPQCTNHDDGVTPAMIQCNHCGFLCSDCDRVLHLNRQTRGHTRTVCKEEEEAIRVELRESCGRTKLFWLLALADHKTLKAMVEFRNGKNAVLSEPVNHAVGRCRFCGVSGNTGLLSVGNVCAEAQCQEYATMACVKVKPCGHLCGGVFNEVQCLPCLQHTCHERENGVAELARAPKLTQDADDMCMICFTEALACAPSCQLECGHVFHYSCCRMVLQKRWTGPRISFGFCQCPICKADIAHELLWDLLEPLVALKEDLKRKALMRLEYEGVMRGADFKDMISYAMDRYAYYVCFKCQRAYYGGEVRCDAEIGDRFDPQELVCGACSDVARAQMCPKHGTDFLEYKCRYCCSVAVFFCFGTTHFCDFCHDDFQRLTNIPKAKLPKCPAGPKAKQLFGEDCPLHVIHPATGEEFALGCGICRNAQTF